jgi:hypothetical protein
MADRTMTLTVAHLNALADRLYNRSKSLIYHDGEARDMATAARVIRYYTAEYSSANSTITISAQD